MFRKIMEILAVLVMVALWFVCTVVGTLLVVAILTTIIYGALRFVGWICPPLIVGPVAIYWIAAAVFVVLILCGIWVGNLMSHEDERDTGDYDYWAPLTAKDPDTRSRPSV